MKSFTDWRDAHNLQSDDKCPETLLGNSDPSLLNKWLARYVVETQREDKIHTRTPVWPVCLMIFINCILN